MHHSSSTSPPTKHPQLVDLREVLRRTGTGATRHYEDVAGGLMPPPIRRGKKFARYVSDEINEVVRARIAGAGDEVVRALVAQLIAARQQGAPSA